jgi:dCMP deaminase
MIAYFRDIALDVSERSKCMSRKIGAVIAKKDIIISTGYNGPPRGMPHCDERHLYDINLRADLLSLGPVPESRLNECPRYLLGASSGELLEMCPAVHAEVNAILNAGRFGISCEGATMYLTCGVPCKNCLAAIINSGIKTVWVEGSVHYDELTSYILHNSSIRIREYPQSLA